MGFPKRQNSGGQDGPSNFLKIKDGESVTGILVGEIHPFWQTGFGITAKIVGAGEGKERFRHNLVVKDEGKYVAKIWEFGPKIYDALSALEESGWDLKTTLITISRVGSTKENTKYTVTPNKKEPTPASLKEIGALELNTLAHRESAPAGPLKNYAPGADDGNLPF